jgi:hypothetical protein
MPHQRLKSRRINTFYVLPSTPFPFTNPLNLKDRFINTIRDEDEDKEDYGVGYHLTDFH